MIRVEKSQPNKAIYEALEKDSASTLRNLSGFYELLSSLRFEGKLSIAKNTARLRKLISYFEEEVRFHMRVEEAVLFPYLRVHIPRLEPMICLLASEHKDFRSCLGSLSLSMAALKKPGSDKNRVIHRINDQGIYLICLLRGHMSVETQTLYRAADSELGPGEKKILIGRFKKYIAGRRKQ